MHLTKRFGAVAAVAVMTAAVLWGGILYTAEPESDNAPLQWFDRKETIYFWYSDDSMTNFINSAAVAFGEEEDVHVIPRLVSESEYLEAINEATLAEDHAPDAYIVSHDSLEKAYLSGLASQIQDVAGICNQEHFPAAGLSAVSYQGMKVAYPLFFETSALLYNKNYLAEWAAQSALKELLGNGDVEGTPPEDSDGIAVDEGELAAKTEEYLANAVPATMNDILNIAYTFDLPMGVEGILKWDVSDIFYNYWITGNYIVVGGDAGDSPADIDIDNPEAMQCLEVYKALNQYFYIESDTVTYDSVVQDFIDGKVVFTIATTDVVKRLEDARAEGRLGFEYGITRMPWVSEELKSRSMSVTNVVAINGYSRHKELANRFAAYLTEECADYLYGRTGKISANLRTDQDDTLLQVFKAEYADSVPLPKMMETSNFWMQLEGLFSKVWNGADVTALIQELAAQIAMQTEGLPQ